MGGATEAEAAGRVIATGVHGMVRRHPRARDGAVEVLATLDPRVVDDEAERLLVREVRRGWESGWSPAEIHRHLLRVGGAHAAELLRLAIGAERALGPGLAVHPEWQRQLDEILPPGAPPGVRVLAHLSAAGERVGVLGAALDTLAVFAALPRLHVLIPPPGTPGAAGPSPRHGRPGVHGPTDGARGRASEPVLAKVRALLAQAESTTFEGEAEAFTAKAHELITRHAIDTALLEAGAAPTEGPVEVRIPIDDPYAAAKRLLAQFVADEGRCRAVYHQGVSLTTVIGYPDDVAAVEMLFTSLLVQAQAALAEAARHAPPGTRTRSRSYRSSFLHAYAHRVRERLREINDAAAARACEAHGPDVLPVLASRDARVAEAFTDAFARVVTSRQRGGTDPAGWASGRMAADSAALNSGDLSRSARDRPALG